MSMSLTVGVAEAPPPGLVDGIFAYFAEVDRRFSLLKPASEVTRLNPGTPERSLLGAEMMEVLALAARTKRRTHGYFDIRRPDGSLDPSGIVKGWAIRNAATVICSAGVRNFFVEAGGDIQSQGHKGIFFIEAAPDLEGYVVDRRGIATETIGFHAFVAE